MQASHSFQPTPRPLTDATEVATKVLMWRNKASIAGKAKIAIVSKEADGFSKSIPFPVPPVGEKYKTHEKKTCK